MNVKQLQKLADFLRLVPRKSFNIGCWSQTTVEEDVSKHIHKRDHTECGFAACAMGWACQIPSFKRAGLRLVTPSYDLSWGNETFFPSSWPEFEDETAYAAAAKFFDISHDEATSLFSPTSYSSLSVTPTQVANKIEKLIK